MQELPSNAYDIIWTNSVLYCLDDEEYKKLSANISRILKPNGKFIVVDTAAQWRDFLNEKKEKLFSSVKNKGVFWGYIRSLKDHERLLKNYFKLNRSFWVAKMKNGSYRECNPPTVLGFNLKQYGNADVVFEGIICEKKWKVGANV